MQATKLLLTIFILFVSFGLNAQSGQSHKEHLKLVKKLNKLIEKDPSDPKNYLELANELSSNLKQYDAIKYYNLAIDNTDKSVDFIYYLRANIKQQINLYEEALFDIDSCLSLNPLFFDAYLLQGEIYVKLGQIETGLDIINNVISISPEPADAYFRRAEVKLTLKDTTGAIQDLNRALEADPNGYLYHTTLGNLNLDLKYFDAARFHFQKAVAIDSFTSYSLFNLAHYYHVATNDLPLAIKYLNKASTLAYNNGLAELTLGDLYFNELHDLDSSMYYLDKALVYNCNLEMIFARKARIYNEQGKYDKAIQILNSIDPKEDIVLFYFERGYAYYYKQEFRNAFNDFSKTIELDTLSSSAYFLRANILYFIDQKPDEAMRDLDKAIEIDPKHELAYKAKAEMYAALGDFPKSISTYNKLIAFAPNNSDAYAGRASSKGRNNDLNGALKDADIALKLDPNNASAYFTKAMVTYLYDEDAGCTLFQKAADLGYEYALVKLKECQ